MPGTLVQRVSAMVNMRLKTWFRFIMLFWIALFVAWAMFLIAVVYLKQ
jgi:hypothetical protein